MAQEAPKIIVVAADQAGGRLDHFLVKQNPEISRSYLKHLIESGDITIGGGPAKPSQILRGGEQVLMRIPPPQTLVALAQDIPLDILYEDEDLLVLNKSAEMVVHLGAGIEEGTVVNALLHHCKDLSGIGGVARPGIVHRLDKGTSGLLVVAKNDRSHQQLSAQFQSRRVEKTYLAFVWGKPRDLSGKIDIPLGRSQRDRKKIDTGGRHLRSAVTRYHLADTWQYISLLELKPETGRTHQLRVHLAALGHPIVGDPTYGKKNVKLSKLPVKITEALRGIRFQLLHAWRLSFDHPTTGKAMDFETPMRAEMRKFKKILGDCADDPF